MIICVDFDGTIVEGDGRRFDDLETPLKLVPGALDGLRSLKRAGHTIVLFSARANRALREQPSLDPLKPEPHTVPILREWRRAASLHEARYRQMLAFVRDNLAGLIDAVDDGRQGKPVADLFIDDLAVRFGAGANALSWVTIAQVYGQPVAPSPLGAASKPVPIAEKFAASGMTPRRLIEMAEAVAADSSDRMLDETYGALVSCGMEVATIGETRRGMRIARAVLPAPPGVPHLIVIAGQHGDETAGPLAFALHAREIVDAARRLGVGLVAYPCANPEGFAADQRWNSQGHQETNNFLEYEVGPGEWSGELRPGQEYLRFREIDAGRQSLETQILRRDLGRALGGPVTGFSALDVHGDSILPPGKVFAYTMGNKEPYARVMHEAPVPSRPWGPLESTQLKNKSWTDVELRTDAAGLVDFRDGSATDWLWRKGAVMSACLETPVQGEPEEAAGIARDWILSMLRALARGESAR